MNNGWTTERRARQAELIRRWRPWEKSSGPTTPEGKAISCRNAYRLTIRKHLIAATYLLKQRKAFDAGLQHDSIEVMQQRVNYYLCISE